jgi:MFS family permease
MNKKTDNPEDKNSEIGNSETNGSRISASRVNTFASFRIPAFRTYYISMVGNWFAMSMQMLVRSLLIYRLTGSATMVGTVSLANAIPTIAISLLGGAIADRMQKKYILLWCRAVSAAITLIIAMTLVTRYLSPEHYGSYWVLIVTSVFDGAINGFLTPTNTSIIPEIIGTERVMNGISLSQMGQNIFRLAGPAVAGFLIDKYDFASVYFLMSGMYIIAAISTAFLPRTGTKIVRGGNALKDTVEGLKYLRRNAILLLVVIFGICHVVSGQPFNQLLPVFTESILKVSASKLGLLSAISAAGALVGSIALASLPNKKRGVLMLFSGVVMSIPIIIFSIFPQWHLALFMMPFIGLGPTLQGTLASTLVQSLTEPKYRSRMQSFVTMAMALATLGTFLAGILSDAFGVQWAVGSMAIFLTLVSFGFFAFIPRLRKLD